MNYPKSSKSLTISVSLAGICLVWKNLLHSSYQYSSFYDQMAYVRGVIKNCPTQVNMWENGQHLKHQEQETKFFMSRTCVNLTWHHSTISFRRLVDGRTRVSDVLVLPCKIYADHSDRRYLIALLVSLKGWIEDVILRRDSQGSVLSLQLSPVLSHHSVYSPAFMEWMFKSLFLEQECLCLNFGELECRLCCSP